MHVNLYLKKEVIFFLSINVPCPPTQVMSVLRPPAEKKMPFIRLCFSPILPLMNHKDIIPGEPLYARWTVIHQLRIPKFSERKLRFLKCADETYHVGLWLLSEFWRLTYSSLSWLSPKHFYYIWLCFLYCTSFPTKLFSLSDSTNLPRRCCLFIYLCCYKIKCIYKIAYSINAEWSEICR